MNTWITSCVHHRPFIRGHILSMLSLSVAMFAWSISVAHGQLRIEFDYAISAAKIDIGRITAIADLEQADYTISAKATVSRLARFLASGEGSSIVHGTVKNGRLVPSSLESTSTFKGDPPRLRVEFEDGHVSKLDIPTSGGDRVPLTDQHLSGVIDPLTALLSLAGDANVPLERICEGRTLSVFDGYLRYDLKLAYDRLDTVKRTSNEDMPAVVCRVRMVPIAGHSPSNPLLKLVADRDLAVTLARLPATSFAAPYRIALETWAANLVVQASRFEAMMLPAPKALPQ
jgi:Protein of unknown function (DUF3108)